MLKMAGLKGHLKVSCQHYTDCFFVEEEERINKIKIFSDAEGKRNSTKCSKLK